MKLLTMYQLAKWICILCVGTLIFNGFLYYQFQKQELLYSLVPATVLALITGMFLLTAANKKA